MLSELETGDDGKFWSSVWEAMLFRHFTDLGFALTNRSKSSGQNGPDFCLSHEGRTIWVEAVVPSPKGIPVGWVEPVMPGEVHARSMPDHPRVLRCTSAIADKHLKFTRYRSGGIVHEDDCAVIAVNICRLSDFDVDGNGISQLPLSLEAVFPLGPLGVPLTAEGELAGEVMHTPRFEVQKASGVDVSTANFLNPAYAGISAVLQGHQRDVFDRRLVLAEIHNPLASNKLPVELFGACKEFVATEDGGAYQLRNIAQLR